MVLLQINSISVDFPYEAYPAQIRYMSHVIEALRAGKNALLESPTGTGKTLCLLCATLAWRATYIAALQAHTLHASSSNANAARLFADAGLRPQSGVASALSAIVQPASNEQLACPRIIFSSRTHSQLSQAVSELRKTIYNPFLTILASRDQLCIHDIASNYSGSRLNAMCRKLTASNKRQCRFHLPIASTRPHENRSVDIIDKLQSQPPMDIEELRDFGVSESACPWFISRTAARSDACEVIFLPYNYLLDRVIRQSLDINWTNDIIIIDEAHNLESICSELFSFDLSASMRSACDVELSKLIENGLRPGGITIPALQNLSSEKEIDSVIGSENRDLLQVRVLRSVLASLESFIKHVQFDIGNQTDLSYKAFPGNLIRNLLRDSGGPTLETYELFLEFLDRIMGVEPDRNTHSNAVDSRNSEGALSTRESTPLVLLQTAIRILFESANLEQEECFRTVVQQSVRNDTASRTLSYWCFKPSIAMKAFHAFNMRCILLTSGTLAPLSLFASELSIPFPVRLENPHVITNSQVWAGIIRAGPDLDGQKGGRLTSAYYARGDDTSVELGRVIIRVVSIVPDGVLVFYPSYAALYSCVDVWKKLGPGLDRSKPSVLEHIQRHKRIVVEDRDNSKVLATVLAHRANVDSGHGSLLLAVCRGKVSEGIDFSDEHGRAVIITGLPYPSAIDPKIVLKRQFADEQVKIYSAKNGQSASLVKEKVMNGSQWYTAQAMRAVNQAVGRAIRHRFDYGAILLCEERFQSKPLQENVSKWLRESLVVHRTFSAAESSLREFFTSVVSMEFLKEGEERRKLVRKNKDIAKTTKSLRKDEDLASVFQAQNAIERLQPPPTTESQFVDQMVSLTEAIQSEKGSKEVLRSVEPVGSILDLNTEGVRGGLRDSGVALGNIPTCGDNGNANRGPTTRSELFLAKRVHRDSNIVPGPSTSKRRKGKEVVYGFRLKEVQGKIQEKFSDRVKRFFGKDARKFSEQFQKILAVHAELTNGPVRTLDQRRSTEQGQMLIQQLVAFTKSKGEIKTGQVSTADELLNDLRNKIPASFQSYFDKELEQM